MANLVNSNHFVAIIRIVTVNELNRNFSVLNIIRPQKHNAVVELRVSDNQFGANRHIAAKARAVIAFESRKRCQRSLSRG